MRKQDIANFIEIVPEWDRLSTGLAAILLAEGEPNCDGWYSKGVIGICAWERDLWRSVWHGYFREHEKIFSRLGVVGERRADWVLCRFTEATARAYQLLHVLLHELGHHHDRMTTKRRIFCGRGEGYAETFAYRHEAVIWSRYLREFGLD